MSIDDISGDYAYQVEFVANSAWRLLALQDANPLSSTHGCFHYAYWRDKTSEFADARFQEASATLGLLSLPCFAVMRERCGAPSVEQLRAGFRAGLGQWSRMQYDNGAYDEWYKGERGYAAAEFTTIAFAFADLFMGEHLEDGDRVLLRRTLTKAADWLRLRSDRIKANHEAAGAAAMALAWKCTGEERFRIAARVKLADTLSRQQDEGWFPEVGGMDLGYCSVLLDYVMLTVDALGESDAVPAMRRLFAYMLPHLHPDGTILGESGLCLNPYVSRLGTGLLSRFDQGAAALSGVFAVSSPGTAGLGPTMADDLRLCRWSHLPLVAALRLGDFVIGSPDSFARSYPKGWTVRGDTALAAYHDDFCHVYFAAAGGGQTLVYDARGRLLAEDRGLALHEGEGVWTTQGYGPERVVERHDDGVSCTIAMCKPSFFFPSFLERLVLRIACTTAFGAKWIRAAIDFYRVRNRTAINQSAAPLDKGQSGRALLRRLRIEEGCVVIDDTLQVSGAAVGADCLTQYLHLYTTDRPGSVGVDAGNRIVKRIDLVSAANVDGG